MSGPILIEVCVDSVESAIAAIDGGADRLELCANLGLGGGTTPSIGLIKAIRKVAPDTTIMVMVRPRVGDFLYSSAEFDVMLEDIRAFKGIGVDGIVIGVLTKDGTVDVECTSQLVQEARPLQVCFHRAVDMTRDLIEAVSQISTIRGVTRILTSGHGKTAPSSIAVLRRFSLAVSYNGPEIMPGSGINARTVHNLLEELIPHGLREIHLSAGCWIPGGMLYKPDGMGMGVGVDSEWGIWRTRQEEVREVREIVDAACVRHNLR